MESFESVSFESVEPLSASSQIHLPTLAALLQPATPDQAEPFNTPWTIHHDAEVLSTNYRVWQLIEAGATSPTVAIATRQHRGRGQWGRQWQSPPGGLYLSAAVRLDLPVADSHRLTLATVGGIATALRQRDIPVGVKWPNDLVIDGQKLGGILIETRVRGDRSPWVVIGIGINWSNPVVPGAIALEPWLQAQHLASPLPSITHLAATTLEGLTQGIRHWQTHDPATLMAEYKRWWVNQGQSVQLGTLGPWGRVMDLTPEGWLLIQFAAPALEALPKGIHLADVQPDPEELTVMAQPGTIRLGYGHHD